MRWSLHDLAPICPVPTCPKYQTRHLLAHQEEIATQILAGSEIYIYWQGGVGSAKTLLWGVLAAAYMIMFPGVRIILFRKDYGLLHETLWYYFTNAIKAAYDQGILPGNFYKAWRVKKPTGYTECIIPNGSRARAGQTKNWSEFMGPTYDAIFVSDAMENNNFGEIFHGAGVVGGLQSRLRGQVSSFCKMPDGSIRDMRRFLIESNPPPNVNELHILFGREPGVRQLGVGETTITYRHIQSSSVQNDHNPASYVAEISAMHSDPNDIKRILEGKTIPYYGGIRVITKFYPEVHVNEFEPDENLDLFAGIDPGTQHPAVIFGQVKRCSFDQEHFITLSEITNLYDQSTHDLVVLDDNVYKGILAHLGLFYPQHFDYARYLEAREALLRTQNADSYDFSSLDQFFNRVHFCIDRAGNRKSAENKDRESSRLILWRYYGIICNYRSDIGLEKSLERVNNAFGEICLCGLPVLLIDQKCELLIDGYSGGYRYVKKRDGSHSDKPIEDHVYEDPADAHRYLLENFFFHSAFVLEPANVGPRSTPPESALAWLERHSF